MRKRSRTPEPAVKVGNYAMLVRRNVPPGPERRRYLTENLAPFIDAVNTISSWVRRMFRRRLTYILIHKHDVSRTDVDFYLKYLQGLIKVQTDVLSWSTLSTHSLVLKR